MIITDAQIQRLLKTHTERSEEDKAAVAVLENFLKSSNIFSNFSSGDKWPNIDGTFEFVSNPLIDRRPDQNFFVQIKGTSVYKEEDGLIKYHLQSLGFPVFIGKEVTSDPGILFIVLNPTQRGKERVFWKHISGKFLSEIDFDKDSTTITLTKQDEIEYSDVSINEFVEKLQKIKDNHYFTKKLDNLNYKKEDVYKIIEARNKDICEAIDRLEIENETRETISKKMITPLEDFCSAVLLLNAISHNVQKPNIRDAWDIALFDRKTKFLNNFLQCLKYIGRRIPEDGQNERLMLKYYDYLWGIRDFLKSRYGISVLQNLEKFPTHIDTEDEEYYEKIANLIEKSTEDVGGVNKSRYFIEKKVPFFIGGKRYYELTLQLSGKYASKFNRIIAYSKEDISTNYTIQIGYIKDYVELWENPSEIKIIKNWKVSIDPAVINKFTSILNKELKLSSNFGEYNSLMKYLKNTEMSFLDIIDLRDDKFNDIIKTIYNNKNTNHFKDILEILHKQFHIKSKIYGKNTIRFLLQKFREETIECVLRKPDETKEFPNKNLLLSSRCSPFENNPFLYNIPGSKSNKSAFSQDILKSVGLNELKDNRIYVYLKTLTEQSGEIYHDKSKIDPETLSEIIPYNNNLKEWDKNCGFSILENEKYVYIEEYEKQTISILKRLMDNTNNGVEGQKQLNAKFIKEHNDLFQDTPTNKIDPLKKYAIENIFVNNKIIMVYGAAGTGKTQLMDYISTLMDGRSKLFLTQTHTAKENLERRISIPGAQSKFAVIDQINRGKENVNYDIVFIDECSTIDNLSMYRLLKKINPNALLVLVGDIHQIESIDFGNWFYYAKDIISPSAIVELTSTWRTEDNDLKSLWEEVRFIGQNITEKLVIDGPFSEEISNNLFKNKTDEEIVLCLNYDGRFGLNNINNYFQDLNNLSVAFHWYEWTYKINDPILFNDTKRFPALYNNLKGKIVDIEKSEDQITFKIEVYKILTALDMNGEFEICSNLDNSTIIKITVFDNKGGASEEERELSRMRSIIPFQIAYAVSIHKSQGLEYDSVKIVIPRSNSDKISHGIFYTAITRAKKKLKLYWHAETMNLVLENIKNNNKKHISLDIIKQKIYEEKDNEI